MRNADAFIAALREVCGERHVLCGGEISEQYTRDWTKRTSGRALAVVLPANTEEVAAVLRLCREQRVAVIPQGGHTGMCGGATPTEDGRELVLALRRMNAIESIDREAMTMTAEAGCILENLQQAAADAGAVFPLNLAAKGSCQIGGNLATNAGGLNVIRYGPARDQCLGLEAVFADGRIVNLLSGLRKDNTGYDLRNLLIGSEGTLAVITKATLKLAPPVTPVLTAWLAPPSVSAALTVLNAVQAGTGGGVNAVEMMPQVMFEMMQKFCPEVPLPFRAPPEWGVLLEVSGNEHTAEVATAALVAALEETPCGDAVIAQSESQRQQFWAVREAAPTLNARYGRFIHTDVAVPVSALPDYVAALWQRLPMICHGLYEIGYGHLGDGNLHVNLRPKDEDPQHHPALAAALLEAVYGLTAEFGGSVSAEHGVGRFKTAALLKYKDPAALAVMRDIKRALDPDNILNPGRVLAVGVDGRD